MKKGKKFKTSKTLVFISVILFILCGCNTEANNNAATNLKKITIKKTNGTSVYQVDENSKIQTVNTVNNKTGITESRSYTYGDDNNLKLIEINNSAYGTSYMYYQTEARRSDGKIISKTKTVSKARGGNETYKIKYHYSDDGKFLGVEMRDGKGNIFTKGVEE